MMFHNVSDCNKYIKKSVCKYIEEVKKINQSLIEEYSKINNPILKLTLHCIEERRLKV